MKIHKGDKVKVIAGKDAGREGVVERTYDKQSKVLIPNINTYKKHVKKSEQVPEGGVVQLSRPLDVSKVMLVCKKCKQTTRIAYVIAGTKKTRICAKCKKPLS